MTTRADSVILKIFPEIPCLSPNRYRGFFILEEFLNSFFKKNQQYEILDAGCGWGIYAEFLKIFGVKGNYLGADLEFKQDVSSFQETQDFKIKFERVNLNKFNLKKKFDLILCLWTLEHLKDDLKVLKILKKHLKKSGIIILSVPSFWTWPFEFGRHGFHYYSLKQLKALAENIGLRILIMRRCGGPFGWLFGLFYAWLSLLILAPVLGVYKLLGKLPQRKTREDLGSAEISRKILNNTIFLYKKTSLGKRIHYYLVSRLSKIDQKIPLLETSYFLVLQKSKY